MQGEHLHGFIILGATIALIIGTIWAFDADSKFKWVFLGALGIFLLIPIGLLIWLAISGIMY